MSYNTGTICFNRSCGPTLAGSTLPCALSNIVNVVIFPLAPPAPVVNPGCGLFTVTPPPTVAGFNIEYSFDDGVTWGPNNPPTADNCAGYRIKTRYVTNAACGITPAGTASTIAGCIESPATIRVVDVTPPVITGTIPPTTIEGCYASTAPPPATTVAALEALGITITDACTTDASLIVTSSDASNGSCPIVITRTYTITDACGNSSSLVHTINIGDNTAPVITGTIPVSNIIGCSASAAPSPATTVAALEALGITINDACTPDANLTVTSSDAVSGTCPIIITRTYRIEDSCGNFITVTQTITVNDTIAPTASNPAPITVQCIGDVPAPDITVVTDENDNCGIPTVTFVVMLLPVHVR